MACDLFYFNVLDYKAGSNVFMHSHKRCELIYYIEGSGKSVIGGEPAAISKGLLVLIPPSMPHDERYSSDSTALWCQYTCDDFMLSDKLLFHPEDFESDEVYQTLIHMKNECKNMRYNHETFMNLLMQQVLITIDRCTRKEKVLNKYFADEIEYVKSFLRDNCKREIDMALLAQHIGYSYSHFRGTFKRRTGVSPHRYLINLRIDKAKRLISDTDSPVSDIAARCGFKGASYFIETFKTETGLTPNQYRIATKKR